MSVRLAPAKPVDTRYDSRAPGDLESPPHTIEVKAFGKSNRGLDLWLEVAQMEEARRNPNFYIYVVENIAQGDPGKFTLKVLDGEHLRRLLERAKEQRHFTVPWPTGDYDATPPGLNDTGGSAAMLGAAASSSASIPLGGGEPSPYAGREDPMSTCDESDSARLLACRTDYDRLDEVARQLGSPPRELRLGELMERAGELLPEFRSKRPDSISATMDYHTINIVGRAYKKPRDFEIGDGWNAKPMFVKVGRGVYRRLSESERARFRHLWQSNEPLLRKPSFEVAEWDRLQRQG